MNKDLFSYLKFVGNFLHKTFNIINLPFSVRCLCSEEIATATLSNELHRENAHRAGHGEPLATVHILQHVQVSKLETYCHSKHNFDWKPSYTGSSKKMDGI